MTIEDERLGREEVIDREHALISSRRVEGTPVLNREDGKLGTIHSVMIDKRTGRVPYALLAFGGLLGIGGRVHPVPWDSLTYDEGFDAYMLAVRYEALKSAPTLRLDEADRRSGRLVQPDQGLGEDVDKQEVAYDVGIDGALNDGYERYLAS